jgi:hypothetical protein
MTMNLDNVHLPNLELLVLLGKGCIDTRPNLQHGMRIPFLAFGGLFTFHRMPLG